MKIALIKKTNTSFVGGNIRERVEVRFLGILLYRKEFVIERSDKAKITETVHSVFEDILSSSL